MTSPDEASLRCRRGTHCTNSRRTTTADGPVHTPDWSTTPNGLCRTDTTLTLRAIEQLPRDYWELSHLLGKTAARTDAPTAGTRDLPVPIRLGVLTLQEQIAAELAIWAAPVAELDGFTFTEHGRPEHVVRYATGWITGRWPSLLTLPEITVARLDSSDERLSGRASVHTTDEDGVDGALNLLALHERVEQVEGRTRRAHKLWSPCPRCQTLALRREEGSPWVDCAHCGHRMTLDAYDQLADILAHAYQSGAAA
ncbi:MAG TPA: hypothetical protein VGL02_27385 [Streptomyces sp.]